MSRVKRGVSSRKKHKKILKKASGYYGARSRVYRVAKQAVIKAQQYAYRDRRCKKRIARRLWITNINAKVRNYGISYNQFMYKLKKIYININRKMLYNLIKNDKDSFGYIMKKIDNIQ